MAQVYFDRVQETGSAGLADFTLGGAVSGYQSFSNVCTNGDTCSYCAVLTTQWEVGLGTYNAGVLARTTVEDSSTGGAKVNFSGVPAVFLTWSGVDAANAGGGGGTGTVTTVSVVTANGFSGSVANANTTPAITLTMADGSVTLAKLADLAQDQFIGRTTASTGVPQTATITAAARTVLDDTTTAAMLTTLGGASLTGTETLTNKRVTARITTIVSNATPTVNTDNCDCVTITALAAAITSMTTNLTGTPVNFDQLEWRIKDDGTARAIAWGASFVAGPTALPTTTILGKALRVFTEWDSVIGKWVCLSSGSDS